MTVDVSSHRIQGLELAELWNCQWDMDDFNTLSLTSSHDESMEESDLLAISKLSISDQRPTTEEIINKFLPYTPSCPSPLRATILVPDGDYSDKMDIDEECYSAKTSTKTNEDLLEEVEAENGEAPEHSSNDEQKGLIKALLSPTSLGIALATRELDSKSDQQLDEPGVSVVETNAGVGPKVRHEADPKQTYDASSCNNSYEPTAHNSPGTLHQTSPAPRNPFQIQVENHHHYYMLPRRDYPIVGQDYYMNSMQDFGHQHEKDLPVPWSSRSNPASKVSYAFTSYLQMALNSITVMIICSTLTALVRTIRTDIKSTWEHQKLELDYESANCKVEYLANHCNEEELVPALIEQCHQWSKCMARNNDVYFRARTSLGAKLFGEIVNSLIEPLGWKAVVVILLTLGIWCFSSNFLLGFMRAKSYYGPPASSPPQLTDTAHDTKQPQAGTPTGPVPSERKTLKVT